MSVTLLMSAKHRKCDWMGTQKMTSCALQGKNSKTYMCYGPRVENLSLYAT